MKYLNDLNETMDKYNIDEIALRSLVESCLDSEDISYKKAQTAYLFSGKESYSEKIENVKFTFNVDYALQILSAAKKITMDDKLGLLVGVLEVIRIIKKASDIKLSPLEAEILYLIAENNAKDDDGIAKELNKDRVINQTTVNQALNNLEKLGIITLEDGIYRNIEKVIIES